MFFRKKNIKLKFTVTQNTIEYFAFVDTILQASSFVDGNFAGPFYYFRQYYFELIEQEMKNMTKSEKIDFSEKSKGYETKILAALSRVLKNEIFEDFLIKMYSKEDIKRIMGEIKQMSARIPVA